MPGGTIVHFGGIQIRVVGSGNYKPTFQGFDDLLTQVLVPIPLSATDSREKFRLCNFISERGKLRLETTEKDEVFKVNNITIFAKSLYTSYPA